MVELERIDYPIYLPKNQLVEVGDRVYVIPEPMVCDSPRDVLSYIRENRLQPKRLLRGAALRFPRQEETALSRESSVVSESDFCSRLFRALVQGNLRVRIRMGRASAKNIV